MGPSELVSFDYDQHSVSATQQWYERLGRPSNWIVKHGSVLDRIFFDDLGTFDVVYSWGVLHHTGFLCGKPLAMRLPVCLQVGFSGSRCIIRGLTTPNTLN